MNKEIFEVFKNRKCKIVIKPKSFVLEGTVIEVFEDCIQFKTDTKTSYLEFNITTI